MVLKLIAKRQKYANYLIQFHSLYGVADEATSLGIVFLASSKRLIEKEFPRYSWMRISMSPLRGTPFG
ncbi:MAG: hypothetical protein A3B10_02595 [Candidatus Doudnabacteria bacterium RIFCSPLOWO2_01_FULL_44_21]|uniref:Uncharacterized protein n=1 Tax=Candidatus Doudnabacteria bacterium RIFCSPLOWO2_01_FULL_44_21 TaxID=1817841 RepID=A0A1F5PX78_9BACT|nr:MAG: hypothetical protein A3B10_02595 [Candidatus Doudnabacteria bacterium RIFCSPLOWO2_01_FULL_44_21]